MCEVLSELLISINRNPPVSEASLVLLHTYLKKEIPSSYEEFLRFSNGIEGSLNKNAYISLWRTEDLITNNQEYSVEEFALGAFLIGSDGGNLAYGFDLREESSTYGYYITIPFIVMDWQDAQVLGITFTDFINALKARL